MHQILNWTPDLKGKPCASVIAEVPSLAELEEAATACNCTTALRGHLTVGFSSQIWVERARSAYSWKAKCLPSCNAWQYAGSRPETGSRHSCIDAHGLERSADVKIVARYARKTGAEAFLGAQ